ncbi:group II intron reverse transcriptase/maturase [Couchioplanes caeruleus]|uniref:RNA-directed DNA polymerase n=1 Tax=Couchioplanes caeruleus TaxID=56438 RepID=A0A3N1GCY8_9ACTN|nr:group II intron reverse transcriptase/maturase [Couchioplanes caeruleus]ROP28100.1 RNA-directed DNA polymerase [Couchioplanes caeruleus]
MPEDSPVNIGDLLARPLVAERRVLEMQTKLHRWSVADAGRRFDDLFNLVADPAFLVMAWTRVRENKGSRTAGVDWQTAHSIEASAAGVVGFLEQVRAQVKARAFVPVPVRQRMIPKASGKLRKLGIPTIADRVVQASLKLVLEPIFEADFLPCSYGFRPERRCQDAIEEIRYLAARSYEWVFEGDIAACFDEIDHAALLDRVRRRIADRRVLTLVKAFLKAGVLNALGHVRGSHAGTPQGGILSPLLANIALSALDEHFAELWQRHRNPTARKDHRRRGGATYRLVRYADDFVVMVSGTREQAMSLWDEVAAIIAPLGLRLAPEKTRVVGINEGFDFLGFRIRRDRQRGSDRYFIYTYPARNTLTSVKAKIKAVTQTQTLDRPLDEILKHLGTIVRGWTLYFRHSSASVTFAYLRYYLWKRVVVWLRRRHAKPGWKYIRRQYFNQDWWPEWNGIRLFDPSTVKIHRYRYRGTKIPTPWGTRPATT